MYVDASQACNELSFQLGTDALGVAAIATRSWTIKVNLYTGNNNFFTCIFLQVSPFLSTIPDSQIPFYFTYFYIKIVKLSI